MRFGVFGLGRRPSGARDQGEDTSGRGLEAVVRGIALADIAKEAIVVTPHQYLDIVRRGTLARKLLGRHLDMENRPVAGDGPLGRPQHAQLHSFDVDLDDAHAGRVYRVQIVDADRRETLAGGVGREIGRTGVAGKARGSKSASASAGETEQ